jgi:hypothetical protein
MKSLGAVRDADARMYYYSSIYQQMFLPVHQVGKSARPNNNLSCPVSYPLLMGII